MLRPERREGAGDRLLELPVGNADNLALCIGWVGQGSEQVECRADAQGLPYGNHVPGRFVVERGEHETEADLVDRGGNRFGSEVDRDSQLLEEVGRTAEAGVRAVAVLGDGTARSGRDQGRDRRGIDRRRATTGARGIDYVRPLGRDWGRQSPHRSGHSGEFLDRLALRPKGDQEGGGLDFVGPALHDHGQDRLDLIGVEVLPRSESVDGPGQHLIRHPVDHPRGSSRSSACLPG